MYICALSVIFHLFQSGYTLFQQPFRLLHQNVRTFPQNSDSVLKLADRTRVYTVQIAAKGADLLLFHKGLDVYKRQCQFRLAFKGNSQPLQALFLTFGQIVLL